MIRDPSDGSTRSSLQKTQITLTGLAPAITPEQRDEIKRLEASREWLKIYRKESGA